MRAQGVRHVCFKPLDPKELTSALTVPTQSIHSA
jgi:hypothetical protein